MYLVWTYPLKCATGITNNPQDLPDHTLLALEGAQVVKVHTSHVLVTVPK